MQRAQLVLDEPIIEKLRAVAASSGASMSAVVRQALVLYFAQQEPDTSWIGALKPKPGISHDFEAIRASVAKGRQAQAPR